jgi:hypothetical protein
MLLATIPDTGIKKDNQNIEETIEQVPTKEIMDWFPE